MKSLSFCILFFCLFPTKNLSADDWTQFRGNERDGKSQETGINDWSKKAPELKSVFDGVGQGYASLCVVDNMIYTTGNSESSQFVVCLDFLEGKVKWKKDIIDVLPNHAVAGSRSTPTYDDGILYVVSSDGQILALDTAQQGKIVWRKSFQKDFGGRLMSGWGFSESPLVDGDKVIVTPGGAEAMVVALDKSTGSTLWKCKLDEDKTPTNRSKDSLRFGAAYSSIIKVNLNISTPHYIAFVGSGLIGINPDTGIVQWHESSVANKTANICMPVFDINKVVYSSSPRGGTAIVELKKENGKIRPSVLKTPFPAGLCCHHGGMILHNGFLFFASGHTTGYPTCIELKTGKRKWGGSFRGPGRGPASVVYVDEKIIFRYQNGMVAMIAANGDKYRPLGHFRQSVQSNQKSWSYPVVVDKKLLLRENDAIMVYRLD